MKRIMGLLLIVALTLGAMGGTVAEKKQVTYNEAYNATGDGLRRGRKDQAAQRG